MKLTRLLVLGLTVFAGACASPRKAVVSGGAGVPVARVETVVAGGLRTPEEVAAYNRVVGETMTALVESGALPRDSADGAEMVLGARRFRVAAPAGLRFDRLIPVAEGGKRRMRRSVEHPGVGVPMVARWEGTPERRKAHPFLADSGYIFPVTVTVEPAVDSPEFAGWMKKRGASEALIARIRRNVGELNAVIEKERDLGPGFRVGHSFFCPQEGDRPDELWYREVIAGEIQPLLEEYFDSGDRVRKLVADLLGD
jgi:hypothetical protein